MKVNKHTFSIIIQRILPHLLVYEDGSVILNRYFNDQVSLNQVIDQLTQ